MAKNTSKDKYALYEESVQTPPEHAVMFRTIYADTRNGKDERTPKVLREDFCGTFQIACEWVRLDSKHSSIGIDLDQEPLQYGRKHHLSKLKPNEKIRVKLLNQNVMKVTRPKADIIAACNFSFYIFKERKTLIDYFKSVYKSLNDGGVFILEMAGGPGMIEKLKEQKTYNEKRTGKFTYIWDQKFYNPITHEAKYSIHFKFPNGKIMKDAFTYDWRIWTLAEVREAMSEAGFTESHIYWEKIRKGKDTGEYVKAMQGGNFYSWIAYAVGVKNSL
jgi:hypothetical protein